MTAKPCPVILVAGREIQEGRFVAYAKLTRASRTGVDDMRETDRPY